MAIDFDIKVVHLSDLFDSLHESGSQMTGHILSQVTEMCLLLRKPDV